MEGLNPGIATRLSDQLLAGKMDLNISRRNVGHPQIIPFEKLRVSMRVYANKSLAELHHRLDYDAHGPSYMNRKEFPYKYTKDATVNRKDLQDESHHPCLR